MSRLSETDRETDYYDSWSFAVGFTTGVILSGVAMMIGLSVALAIGL